MEQSNYDAIRDYELDTWSRCSPSYNKTWATLTSETLPLLISKTNINSSVSVLDIGCGAGNSTKKISETGANVIGIDFSEKMILEANSAHDDIIFKQSDAENIPQEDSSMDVVIANFIVHHLPEPNKVGPQAMLFQGFKAVTNLSTNATICMMNIFLQLA